MTRLVDKGYQKIVVIDKHRNNLAGMKSRLPGIVAEYADLAKPGAWQTQFDDADIVIMLQAQIGGNDLQQFIHNNCDASRLILDQIKHSPGAPRLIHISSSVVESSADDYYTNTKEQQEKMAIESGLECPILRPTLMFGWYDRKHLGWLARFLKKSPLFPIPGDGHCIRQPLYVGDVCQIIISCIERQITGSQILNRNTAQAIPPSGPAAAGFFNSAN